MEERTTPPAATPAVAAAVPQLQGLDKMPYERTALAALTPAERAAIYLNQIRKMMVFFVILTVLGIIAGVIIGIIDINAIHNAQQTQTPTLDY